MNKYNVKLNNGDAFMIEADEYSFTSQVNFFDGRSQICEDSDVMFQTIDIRHSVTHDIAGHWWNRHVRKVEHADIKRTAVATLRDVSSVVTVTE